MLLLLLQAVSDERRWRPLLFSHCLAPSSSSICLSLCITFHRRRRHHHHHNYCCYLSEDIFRSESVGEKVASSSQKASGQRLQTAIMVILGRQRRSFTHSLPRRWSTQTPSRRTVCVCFPSFVCVWFINNNHCCPLQMGTRGQKKSKVMTSQQPAEADRIGSS